MTKITALLIDDQKASNLVLQEMLKLCAPEIEIIGVFENPVEALQAINELQPDIIFSDIDMPGLSGFELNNLAHNTEAKVVYVTGYPEKAVEALRLKAFDFLIKPLHPRDLLQCINRIKLDLKSPNSAQMLNFEHNTQIIQANHKILINKHDSASIIDKADIIYVEAHGQYSNIFYTPNKKIESSKPISVYTQLLSDVNFVRPHKSYIININHIKEIIKQDKMSIIELSDGLKLELNKKHLHKLFEAIPDSVK